MPFFNFFPKWGSRFWNKPQFWNTFAADQLVFQNRGFTVCILDWSLFHRNHHIRLASCSGKDFSTLKLWKLSDFKNLKNSEGAGRLNLIKRKSSDFA